MMPSSASRPDSRQTTWENIHVAKSRSADIPDHQNCSLFILNLPPNSTVTEILGTVRDTGRVFATHINPPEPGKDHNTCAAKLTFFGRRAAETFYNRHAGSGLRICGRDGYVGRIRWNRVKAAESTAPADHTRVLMISGPRRLVNPVWLTEYFNSKVLFSVDAIVDMGWGDQGLVEYRFGSYRCQAEAAKMAIERELYDAGVRVWFGRDSCS
ncbi:hypothetical protein NKR19_g1794 [Coniochaeta hoffmannii]|uniref:RRM domain-containing protein n=1 Tax=Coniochaeta hoffmannii TaxID=91930 RepID=A0AA38VSR3_9PEZI|nr:hypothetical protein NKR19_g1794 [Coniochaeta hoffmannii]